MNYTQLRAFHNVAIHGGFSLAAEALHQTQPSVSEQVRRLEQAHDVLLFHRETRNVRLTEAGEGLFRLTREFFEVEERIASYMDHNRAEIQGTLRIIADSAQHVTNAVSAFRMAHPKVFVSIKTGNTEDVLRRLRAYDAEVGVVGNISPAPDLELVDLGQTPIVVVAQKGYLPRKTKSLRLADLAAHPLIFREAGSRTRAELDIEAERQNITLTPTIEVEGREALREVVASGAGIGFVSEAEFGHDPRLEMVPLKGATVGMSEALVTLAARQDVPVIRAFLRTLKG